jgi:predicted ATP-grasp superfamily ATP-dependent carboligase
MSPPRTGPSVRLRTVDDAELVAAALAVFRALRWSGLASADFIRDVEGRFYFLEVNPRPWGSIAAAEAAGVDLFTPLAQLLTGGTPAPQLACRAGTSSTLFPQHMQALAAGGTLGSLGRALADVSAWRAAPWHRPGLVLHLLRWPWWQWRRARGA